jgi:hypothetical protein
MRSQKLVLYYYYHCSQHFQKKALLGLLHLLASFELQVRSQKLQELHLLLCYLQMMALGLKPQKSQCLELHLED